MRVLFKHKLMMSFTYCNSLCTVRVTRKNWSILPMEITLEYELQTSLTDWRGQKLMTCYAFRASFSYFVALRNLYIYARSLSVVPGV